MEYNIDILLNDLGENLCENPDLNMEGVIGKGGFSLFGGVIKNRENK